MKRPFSLCTALLLAALSAGSLGAQEHPHGERGERRPGARPGPGKHPMMHPASPAAILMHREMLGLTPAQVQRLEALAATERQAMERLRPEMMRASADLMEAARGDVDLERARAALDRLAQLHTEMIMVHLRAQKEARQVLTPEQRARLDAMPGARKMPGMMHGHPGGDGTRPGGAHGKPGTRPGTRR